MKKNKKNESFWFRMWPYLKEFKPKLIFSVICALIVGVFVAIQPFIIKYIVDDGIAKETLQGLDKIRYVAMMCVVYIVVSASRVLLWQAGFFKIQRALEGSLFNLRTKFFAHVQGIGMKFYQSVSAGELFNCILGSPMNNIKTYMNSVFMAVPYQMVAFVISLSALIFYDWLLTVILLATTICMALLNKYARRKMRLLSRDYIQSESEATKYLTDTLNGIDAVELYSIEENTLENFQARIGNMYEKGVTMAFSQHKEAAKVEILRYVGTAVVYLVGAISCVYRGVSIGVLYAFLSSMGEILNILISWLNLGVTKASAMSGLNKIYNILETDTTVPEKQENLCDIAIAREQNQRKNGPCVEFRDVSFAYDNVKIFEDFNCKVNYGESVALVGSSGSGKSTFSKLLMRLYDVQNGSIRVHGEDVRDYPTHDLRVNFGIVPQNPFIFYGSIWDNIKMARPDASNKDIINAMEIANVHEFVNNLEKGWNTIVGDGGLDLSGGQRQRIAIARAVLGDPDILIFDEATSALDNISERAIQSAMEELMKSHTVIVIAHRLSTIKNVNRIMVFEQGKVVEEGTFNALAEKENGKFAELLKHGQ
ncbi:MAG: ABC transporter ATP-binding protein [Clostridia bacterium]|nr:ABC transporter ATP-binding protein [Clostridia bacterium]